MPHELPKAYEPGAIETRWADYWKNEKLFHARHTSRRPRAQRFSLLLPPPNVTGRLHMGHMLNQTEMDIIIRWHRMRGDLTLWLPGTDHAGIATQMMVERQLRSEGKSRRDLGREAFIAARLGVEATVRRRDSRPDEAAGRFGRLAARVLHHGRESLARRARSLRPAVRSRD